MREIKFRAHYIGDGRIYDVIEWSFEGKQDILLRHKDGTEVRAWLKNIDMLEHTGLKDKNGVEVYEGDMVRERGNTRTVEYVAPDGLGNCGFDPFLGGSECCGCSPEMGVAECVVIGNRYENPELLEDKE